MILNLVFSEVNREGETDASTPARPTYSIILSQFTSLLSNTFPSHVNSPENANVIVRSL